MAIQQLRTWADPIAEGMIMFGKGLGEGYAKRGERELKEKEIAQEKKKDILNDMLMANMLGNEEFSNLTKQRYLEMSGLAEQDMQAVGGQSAFDSYMAQNPQYQSIRSGGIQPPNMQPMTVNQIQGLPRVGLNDVLMNKQFGYQTDPMVARELAIEQQKKQMEFNLKEQEKIRSKSVEAEMLSPTFKAIVDDYKGAVDEIKANAPDALKTGFEGYLGRVGLKLGSSQFIDEFPKAAALVDNIKADATSIAKAAGEQRPTDEDIYRFTSILLNPTTRSLNTNIAKLESLNKRWKGQGLNTDWTKPYLDYLKNTAKEVSGKKIKIGNEEVTIRLKE